MCGREGGGGLGGAVDGDREPVWGGERKRRLGDWDWQMEEVTMDDRLLQMCNWIARIET